MDPTIISKLPQFIVGLAVLIILHEFGHFIASRLLKVKVDEFGLGFPPRLVGTARDKDGKRRWFGLRPPENIDPDSMIFSFNWIPLGGFVRPRGENDPNVEGGLAASNPWTRLAVYSAGPAMNIIVGLLLAIMYFYTTGDPIADKIIVGSVERGSPAEQAGLKINDVFVSVNGVPIKEMSTVIDIVSQNNGIPVTLVLLRESQEMVLTVIPELMKVPNPDPDALPTEELRKARIGVLLDVAKQPISVQTAVLRGFQGTYDNIHGIFALPVRMIRGETSQDEARLVGYKGMYDIFVQLPNPWIFFSAISLSLGVVNLFPIPALDGGRILLTLPEIIFRRRIPTQYENMMHAVGFILLLALLIYVNLQDFINPIKVGWP